jgi:hypothetical protein
MNIGKGIEEEEGKRNGIGGEGIDLGRIEEEEEQKRRSEEEEGSINRRREEYSLIYA